MDTFFSKTLSGTGMSRGDALALAARSFPCLRWQLVSGRNGNQDLRLFNAPVGHDGRPLTLREMVRAARGELAASHFAADRAQLNAIIDAAPPQHTRLIAEFSLLLCDLRVTVLHQDILSAATNWLLRAAAGQRSTIVSVICPDYAHDGRGRYTFDALGSGVGLVGERLLEALPRLVAFLDEQQLPVDVTLAMADIEGDSDANLARVQLNRAQFLERLYGSAEALQQAALCRAPTLRSRLQVCFVTDLLPEGRTTWAEYTAMARRQQELGLATGCIALSGDELTALAARRASLYRRWMAHGNTMASDLELLEQAAPDYIAMGCSLTEHVLNPLVLCADAIDMAPFWQGGANGPRPVLHLQRQAY